MSYSPRHLFGFIFLLSLLAVLVQLGVLTIAFDKLGLSAESALLLFISSLIGSAINLPVANLPA